jgi:CheY-like chemotaxis protein/GGDEF domain-containing protein
MQTTKSSPADILVVEDDPSIATVLEEILTGKDYTVRLASNPTEALAAVDAQEPELVLMDINLSSDIDGIETVRRLREGYEDLAVCFITAFSDDETVNRAEQVGPMAYLVKPFEMADVLTMVNISLAGARRTRDRVKKLVAEAGQRPAGEAPAAPPAPPEVLDDKQTGLPNRRYVELQVANWSPESANFVAVLMVDHIELLRQRFGASALEQILFSYTQHVAQHLPNHCVLTRWEQSTFVVIPEQFGIDVQRQIARVVAAPMLYHLRLPGRSALLRVSATMRLAHAKGRPLPEQIDAVINAHR